MGLATVILRLLRETLTTLQVNGIFTLGQPLPATVSNAPEVAFNGDTSGSYFSGTIVDYAYAWYNSTTGEITDIATSAEINFFEEGDGVAVFADLPAVKVNGGFVLVLLRYDSSNVGQWQIVADLSGTGDTFEDDNTTFIDYWGGPVSHSQSYTPGGIPKSVNGTTPDPTTGDISISASDPTALKKNSNLSDVANAATARSNLGANNATNINAGTLANARTTAATTATANSLVLRDSTGALTGQVGVSMGAVALAGLGLFMPTTGGLEIAKSDSSTAPETAPQITLFNRDQTVGNTSVIAYASLNTTFPYVYAASGGISETRNNAPQPGSYGIWTRASTVSSLTQRMLINSTGQTCIGKTIVTPLADLHINGTFLIGTSLGSNFPSSVYVNTTRFEPSAVFASNSTATTIVKAPELLIVNGDNTTGNNVLLSFAFSQGSTPNYAQAIASIAAVTTTSHGEFMYGDLVFYVKDLSSFPYLQKEQLRLIGGGAATFSAPVKCLHLIGGSAAPTIAAGSAAGTGPTISVSGTNMSGTITLTTGTSTVTGVIATVTFNTAAAVYSAAPKAPDPAAGNAAAAALSGTSRPYFTSTATTLVLNSGSVALAASTQYIFRYGPLSQ